MRRDERRDRLYLDDIITNDFLASDLICSAVLQKLTIIGEAAARLSVELRNKYPGVPWADVVAFRNIAVHANFNVDWRIVWGAAAEDAPTLGAQAQAIRHSEGIQDAFHQEDMT